ncbi:ABC transporter substrate-binding protein [Paracoccus seriniphilus]|uniref:Iron(III) transport system substrate-binding protein n=1 Tax=Paracoccus seriniphilus TaxID=184748 RepID=A0A239PZ98_9RHOB|nr:substrate-binding domain-containing protein [Paracoccus seriniphilus]WCR15672.1 ABC transporter substrate-binding protein [Paracoccus seriniphilus]SNT75651.1 iron(III) transport system substrate-binding protein [Paracoccus seriniphilus]
MRHLVLAALVTLGLTTQSHAYEIEEQQIFGAGAKEISVLSTTDLAAISQVMQAFADARPDLRIRYDQAASIEVFRAIHDEAVPYDLVMSSAMDLQMKLANDGFAASIMPKLGNLPAWARWRDQLFGVALEPVVTLASRRGLGDLPVPHTRRDLIAMMREHPDALNGRIATYDPQQSGVGYFLISQDSRESEGFWRLAEVMGRLNTRLFCCSVEMIDELRAGRITIAYNVVASYASRFTPGDPDLVQLALEDYTFAIVRSALVPSNANDPQGATDLLSFLLSDVAQRQIASDAGVALMPGLGPEPSAHLRPIRLDTGLLVYGDQLRRAGLLAEWNAAMVQP